MWYDIGEDETSEQQQTGSKMNDENKPVLPALLPALTAQLLSKSITPITVDGRGALAFRIVGEPVCEVWRAAWLKRGSPLPWCHLAIGYTGNPYSIKAGDPLSWYGGELWPSAWPAYFKSDPHKENGGAGVILTEAGAAWLKDTIQAQGQPVSPIVEIVNQGVKAIVDACQKMLAVPGPLIAGAITDPPPCKFGDLSLLPVPHPWANN